jgi:hypothetical protein
MLLALALAFSASWVGADAPKQADLTKRQSRIAEKQVPLKMHELKMNEQFSRQTLPIKRWHAEFSPIGQRRSSIQVRENREKTMIRPQVTELKTVDLGMSPLSGRMAYVRNFDEVRDNHLVPKYRDATVVSVKEISTPAPSNKQEELSMRELNRFSFQRNHLDSGGAHRQRTAAESE